MDFIVVRLKINCWCVCEHQEKRPFLRTSLVCFVLIAVFRKSTLDKKQSALLFIESNELINLNETVKRAIGTAGSISVSLRYL